MKKPLPQIRDGNTLVNLASSILRHFGAKAFHLSIDWVDEKIEPYSKIVVLLLDGLGYHVRRAHASVCTNLISNEAGKIESVNPPTTVAATTAFLSGRYPKETGWLGWVSYLEDGNVLSFSGKDAVSEEPTPRNLYRLRPYKNLIEMIRDEGHEADLVYPVEVAGKSGSRTIRELLDETKRKLDGGHEFIYAYWTEPDHTIHEEGVDSPLVREKIADLDKAVGEFVSKLGGDTCLLVIADHGLIDVENVDIAVHPDLVALQRRGMSIEGRTASFFLKPGKETEFEELFSMYYPEIDLYTHEEVVASDFFGVGKPHASFDSSVGEFVAIPRGNELLCDTLSYPKADRYMGHHAGQTPMEKEIGVSFFGGKH